MTVCSNWVSPFTASLQKTRAPKKPSPSNTAVAGGLLSYLTAVALAQLPGSFQIITGTPPTERGHRPNSPVLPLGCSHLGLMSLIRAAINHHFSPLACYSSFGKNQRLLAAQGAGRDVHPMFSNHLSTLSPTYSTVASLLCSDSQTGSCFRAFAMPIATL